MLGLLYSSVVLGESIEFSRALEFAETLTAVYKGSSLL
jgi:hypothetical protein